MTETDCSNKLLRIKEEFKNYQDICRENSHVNTIYERERILQKMVNQLSLICSIYESEYRILTEIKNE